MCGKSSFSYFETYVGQEELIFANIAGIGEIYKIHGSVTDASSLVLTSKDYSDFEERSSYLIAKLLTIFLEYPIIFIGYSLNDRNIRNIFETISKCLSQEKLNLRRDIYELAHSSKPTESIVATGFENLDDISKAEKFILGVGIAKNGHMIKAEQLYEDIVLDNQHFNPSLVVEEYLPELLKNNSGGLPMYKYLKEYEGEVFERVKNNMLKYTTVDSFLNQQLRQQKRNYRKTLEDKTVDSIIVCEGEAQAYKKIIFLNEDEIEITVLHKYLQEFLKHNTSKCLNNNSELKRLIRIYDLVKYK